MPLAAALAVILAIVGWLVWRNWLPSAPGAPVSHGTTATSVQLGWTRSVEGPEVDQYLVVRDGTQVGSVAGSVTTYLDRSLKPDSTYRYTVIAGSGSKRSVASATLVVRTLPAPPTAVTVVASGDTVTVRWGPPTVGSSPDGYVVLRDGGERATVPGTARSFRDTGLAPRTTWSYSVQTLTAGLRSEPAGAASVTIPDPPIAAGRLQGAFDISGRIVAAKSGDTIGDRQALGQTFTDTWQFSPSCADGPCDKVALSGYMFGHPFSMTLSRSGSVYTGSTKAHLSHCGAAASEISVTNTVKLRITVTKADMAYATWSAMSWTGTITMLSPYTEDATGYCSAGTMVASVTGAPAGTTQTGSPTGPTLGAQAVTALDEWVRLTGAR